jgi:hypothetical protein
MRIRWEIPPVSVRGNAQRRFMAAHFLIKKVKFFSSLYAGWCLSLDRSLAAAAVKMVFMTNLLLKSKAHNNNQFNISKRNYRADEI